MVGNICNVISGTNFTVGFYQILSAVPGVSITVDRAVATGVGAAGVVNIGGALSLGSAAGVTDTIVATTFVAGNTVWVNTSGATLAATFTVTAGASGTPINISGYQTVRGDNPTGANRPTITCSTFTFNPGSNNMLRNFIFTGSGTNVLTVGGGAQGITRNCKIINTSTTVNRTACNIGSTNSFVIDCEAISYRGFAYMISNTASIMGCYAHDSSVGIALSNTSVVIIRACLVDSCAIAAVNNTGSGIVAVALIEGCTFYGSENKTGNGINIVSGTTALHLINNIFYGFVTGINDANAAGVNFGDYNLLFNNTTNYTNFTAGANDVLLNPGLSQVAQITGTNGTTSGSVLTSAGANFGAVVDNVDFVYIVSGTGITVGQYPITSHTATTLTLGIAPGDSGVADKVFQITTGNNFAGGPNIKQIAFPHAFQGGLTTSYGDLGGVQRDGDADQPAASDVKQGVIFDAGQKTGTFVAGGGGATVLGSARVV